MHNLQIRLRVLGSFTYSIGLSAVYEDNEVFYIATLEGTTLSYFDYRKDHKGKTIESAISSIAVDVESALRKMSGDDE